MPTFCRDSTRTPSGLPRCSACCIAGRSRFARRSIRWRSAVSGSRPGATSWRCGSRMPGSPRRCSSRSAIPISACTQEARRCRRTTSPPTTLPLLMGVTAVPARDSLRIALSSPVEPPAASLGFPGFTGPEAPRIGLYRSYAAAIDEGWTRWLFDTWKVPYASVVDSVVRAGKLKDHFDVIVLPDQSPHELFDGLPRQYPAPYAGGLGDRGGGGATPIRGPTAERSWPSTTPAASPSSACSSPCATSSRAWPTTNSTLPDRSSGSSWTRTMRSRAACRSSRWPGMRVVPPSRCSIRARRA